MDDLIAPSLPAPPAGRYRRVANPARRRALLVAAGVAVLLLVGLGVWIARGVFADPVQWQDGGYQVTDTAVTMTFQVTKAPSATAVCRVHALNVGFGEVGVVDVEVGPATVRTQTMTAQVPTSERAVYGEVQSCTITRS